MLFGCYRRGDANDPDTYVAAMAAVLARYDSDLIREVTDPNSGIQTNEKYMSFMPNSGELKVYCEGVAARRERVQSLAALPAPDFNRARLPPPERRPGDQATVFVPASHPRYQAFLKWSESGDPRKFKFEQRPGIWVSWDTWDLGPSAVRSVSDIAKDIVAEMDAKEPVHA